GDPKLWMNSRLGLIRKQQEDEKPYSRPPSTSGCILNQRRWPPTDRPPPGPLFHGRQARRARKKGLGSIKPVLFLERVAQIFQQLEREVQ
ncbi:unnamed protein product, partial [Sphagnum jensenii]